MPVWHEATREWVKQGKLALLGVTQEQHADRCRLFAQWKRFDWPILHDPIDLLEAPAVPIIVAIDEHGIIRAVRPRLETFAAEFLDKTFDDDAPSVPKSSGAPDPDSFLRKARATPGADLWRAAGDALTIWGGAGRLDQAIDAYTRALALDPSDKNSLFRLGVAYRIRHESAERRNGDFQSAVEAWGRALELDPNQYIWRRRIEQYGPRLTKPYAFYDWVEPARAEIARRGETPVRLTVEPYGSELAGPSQNVLAEEVEPVEPDPKGRIRRDEDRLVEVEVGVVPRRVRPGGAARVHLTLRPNKERRARWNNESTPLRVWITAPEAWSISHRLLVAPQGDQAESDEVRRLDFEVKVPSTAERKTRLSAYALYNACEEAGGRCMFLRQDLTIDLNVTK